MTNTKTRKVLMVVTNVNCIPGTNVPTGFFLRELTHPYNEVHEVGFEVDVASIQGGPAPIDPHSDPRLPNSSVQDDIVSIGFLNSPQHAAKIANTLRLADVDLTEYEAIFFSGGAGAIFDFPSDQSVVQAIATVWDAGKIVGTVCHGSGALLNVMRSNGTPLVKGFEVTGLITDEENDIHKQEPEYNAPLYLEDELPKLGALFRKAPMYVPFAITSADGQLVTGQNNRSGTLVGRHLATALLTRLNDSKA